MTNLDVSSYMYIHHYISICAEDEHNMCLLSIAHHMVQVLVQHMTGNRDTLFGVSCEEHTLGRSWSGDASSLSNRGLVHSQALQLHLSTVAP